jgi:hypothetical protein
VDADALHTRRGHARFLIERKKAHFSLIVSKSQRALYRQLKQVPSRQVSIGPPAIGDCGATSSSLYLATGALSATC